MKIPSRTCSHHHQNADPAYEGCPERPIPYSIISSGLLRMRLSLILSVAAFLMFAGRARAQVDPFEFEVYPYQTLGAGMIELEADNSLIPNGHNQGDLGTSSGTFASDKMYRTSLQLTYGLTDRIEAAAYLNLAHPNGSSFQYAGSSFRLRGRLFQEGELPLDLGWYTELEWHRTPEFDDNELELELKPIIEKDFGRTEIDINPIFEKAIFVGPNHNKGFEFGYAVGAYYNYLQWLTPGVEFYGGIGLIDDSDPLSEQEHYIFPVIRGEMENGIEYNFGPGFGLTSGSDRVVMKFNLELERYVGAWFE